MGWPRLPCSSDCTASSDTNSIKIMSKKHSPGKNGGEAAVTGPDGTGWLAEHLLLATKSDEEGMLDLASMARRATEYKVGRSTDEADGLAAFKIAAERVLAPSLAVMMGSEVLVKGPNPLEAAMRRAGEPWSAKASWDFGAKIRSDDKRNAARVFAGLYALKTTRQVYEFDSKTLDFLVQANGMESIPATALAGFKDRAAFIEERGPQTSGWLVSWDELDCEAQAYGTSPLLDEVSSCTCISIVRYDDAKPLKYQPTILPVIPGWTMGKCLAAARELGSGVDDTGGVDRDLRGVAGTLYLCSERPQIRIAVERLHEELKLGARLRGVTTRRHLVAETIGEGARVAESRTGGNWPVADAGQSIEATWQVGAAGQHGEVAFTSGLDASTLHLAEAVIAKKHALWQTHEEGGDVYTLQRHVSAARQQAKPDFESLIDYSIDRMRLAVKEGGGRSPHFYYSVACQDGSIFAGDFNSGKLMDPNGRAFAGDLLAEWVKQRGGVAVAMSFFVKPPAPKTKPEEVAMSMFMKGHNRLMTFKIADVLAGAELRPTVDSEGAGGFWNSLLDEVLVTPA